MLFAEDEGVPPERRLDAWKEKWMRREGLIRLLQDDDRYIMEGPGL